MDRTLELGVVAVATRDAAGKTTLSADDEHDLELAGFLTFLDPPKADAAAAIARLHELHVEVKVITGDNDRVAAKVCADLGLPVRGVLTGAQLETLDGDALAAALPETTVFARVTPEQKSRVINVQRALGSTVGFMGDGVNDAVALHDADVGISVERDGKEGVDGSSPSEGSAKAPHAGAFAFRSTCRLSRVRWVWSRLWSSGSWSKGVRTSFGVPSATARI